MIVKLDHLEIEAILLDYYAKKGNNVASVHLHKDLTSISANVILEGEAINIALPSIDGYVGKWGHRE